MKRRAKIKNKKKTNIQKPYVNAKIKDRLFRKLFGDADKKENILSLYNALNNSDYTNEDALEIYTIDDVVYMGMKNDVAYIIDSYIALHEHQSTLNPNMPLRGMLYFSKLYEKFISLNNIDLYSSTLKKIPSPQFYVFYNGKDIEEDRIVLKLSDAFIHPIHEGDYEWTAILLNINLGHNLELLNKCHTLFEYASLVDRIKELIRTGLETKTAIVQAVDWAIQNNILTDFLKGHKSEVIGMILTEYKEKTVMENLKKEAYDSGYDSGYDNGYDKAENNLNLLYSKLLAAKRYDDAERSTNDPSYREKLIKELLPDVTHKL